MLMLCHEFQPFTAADSCDKEYRLDDLTNVCKEIKNINIPLHDKSAEENERNGNTPDSKRFRNHAKRRITTRAQDADNRHKCDITQNSRRRIKEQQISCRFLCRRADLCEKRRREECGAKRNKTDQHTRKYRKRKT